MDNIDSKINIDIYISSQICGFTFTSLLKTTNSLVSICIYLACETFIQFGHRRDAAGLPLEAKVTISRNPDD